MTKFTNSKQRKDIEYADHLVSVIEVLNFNCSLFTDYISNNGER